MSDTDRREHEAAALIVAAVVGEASPEELAQLNKRIEENPELGQFVVDLLAQEAWLTWSSASARKGAFRRELAEHITQVIQESQAHCASLSGDSSLSSSLEKSTVIPATRTQFQEVATVGPRNRPVGNLALAACLLIVTGAVLGWAAHNWHARNDVAVQWDIADAHALPGAGDPYVARLVQGTACLWTPESTMSLGASDALRTGESLRLLEGMAEVRLDWTNGGADLHIEGPAGLVLTAERGASLSHGKFTVDIELADDTFVLDTPNGEVELSGHGSIGVSVVSGDVEVHVFKGGATFVTPWSTGADSTERIDIRTGDSLRVAANADGRMEVVSDTAHPERFASKLSMGSDNLFITDRYVNEILKADPLIYWRFEGSQDGLVRNEAGSKYNGRVVGSPEWLQQGGNRHVALGAGLTSEELGAYIVSEDPVADELQESYSVEMWFKPSHYHWGTILSMIGKPPQPGWVWTHGLLLELGGPRAAETSIERPGKVRFLHRDPPGDAIEAGTSCFSQQYYELRKWQHLVAVKDGSQMRLYLNGQLTATDEDPTSLAQGLVVLVGQLDEDRDYRRFVGQLDELAIYPRALREDEVQDHYRLVRAQEPPLRTLPNRSF